MSYIGNTPTTQNFVAGADQFSGTGSQIVFTLSRNVNTVFDIFVAISNVPQDPYSAYSVSGNTLTFTSAPPSGTGNIYVVYRATNVQTFVPSPGATVGGSFGIQGNLNFYGTGNRITGDFSNGTIANRVMFQSSTTNGQTSIGVLPNGTGGISSVNLFGTTDPANASLGQLATTTNEVRLQSGITGTGTYLPMTFYTGGSERMRIDTAGITKFRGTGSAYDSTPGDGVSDGLYLQVDSSGIAHIDSYAGSGSTNLAFGTNSGGGAVGERMRIDSSGNVQLSTAGTKVLNSSGRPILNQTGSILQVINVYKTDVQTISSGTPTFVDITGLSITITPASSSSTFLVMWSVVMGNGTDASHGYVRLNRNGTAIALANAAGNRTTASSGIVNTAVAGQSLVTSNSYLDSPATASAITYKLTASNNNVGSSSTFINRSSRDTDLTGYDGRSTSSLTVMEISA